MSMLGDIAVASDFLSTVLRLSIPIIFAALGGVLAERAGVFNVALEGCILGGAFGAAAGAYLLGTPFGGLALGLMITVGLGCVLAGLAVGLGINQLVAGIAINILVLGLTSYLARLILGADATSTLPGFHPIAIPFLSSIPLIGPVLFNQDLLAYLMYLAVPLTYWFLFKTPWGLIVRAIGDYPIAADTVGVSVPAARALCVIASCALGGLGGCYLVLSQVFVFTENMSAGKGWIALAAVILGRWNPALVFVACIFFAFSEALQLRLQFNHPDVPYQLFSMVPFVASFLALVFFAGQVRPPAAIGKKYIRGGK
jgi:simple sugar transport system permease protein